MVIEVPLLGEPLLADVAPVRLFSRVQQVVYVQVAKLRETFVANLAHVRPFARVRPKMDIEVCQLAERLCADVALKVLLSVYPFQRVR